MSGRFVRSSKYRHVFGDQAKSNQSYQDLKILASGDGNYAAANGKYIAVPINGGGGPVAILEMGKTGRVGSTAKKVSVHKSKVLEVAFSPVNQSLLATGSDDCTAAVSAIPADFSVVKTADVALSGHTKKVTNLAFHPCCQAVLATGSADNTVKLWDIESATEKSTFREHTSVINSLQWNNNGSLLASSSKDKTVKLLDPRDGKVADDITAHSGTKKTTALFANDNELITVGFNRSSCREFFVYDLRDTSKPKHKTTLGQAAGTLIAHFDGDNGLLYLAGKGDSSISYFEVTSAGVFRCGEFRDTKSQKGMCFLPKNACDASKTEIARGMRVMRDSIVPISFVVPRKSDMFQDDLFPDTYAGVSCLSADDYFAGKNVDKVPTMSMKPGEGVVRKEETLTKKKSKEVTDLEDKLAKANARIAELEAEVAKLKV